MKILSLGKTNIDSWKLLPRSMPAFFLRGVLCRAFSGTEGSQSQDLGWRRSSVLIAPSTWKNWLAFQTDLMEEMCSRCSGLTLKVLQTEVNMLLIVSHRSVLPADIEYSTKPVCWMIWKLLLFGGP